MRRDSYIIQCNDGRNATKYAWNAALREIHRMVKDKGQRGEVFELAESCSVKGDDGRHIAGSYVWRSEKQLLMFSINKSGAST